MRAPGIAISLYFNISQILKSYQDICEEESKSSTSIGRSVGAIIIDSKEHGSYKS